MKKEELKKNVRVWCWWKSRYLYYTGQIINREYEFEDICGAKTMIEEKCLSRLEVK